MLRQTKKTKLNDNKCSKKSQKKTIRIQRLSKTPRKKLYENSCSEKNQNKLCENRCSEPSPPPEKNDMRTGASTKKTPKKSYMRTDAARKHRKNYIRRGVPATKIPNKTI
jgi:hypothetical protein